jgi:hypothetical protein
VSIARHQKTSGEDGGVGSSEANPNASDEEVSIDSGITGSSTRSKNTFSINDMGVDADVQMGDPNTRESQQGLESNNSNGNGSGLSSGSGTGSSFDDDSDPDQHLLSCTVASSAQRQSSPGSGSGGSNDGDSGSGSRSQSSGSGNEGDASASTSGADGDIEMARDSLTPPSNQANSVAEVGNGGNRLSGSDDSDNMVSFDVYVSSSSVLTFSYLF